MKKAIVFVALFVATFAFASEAAAPAADANTTEAAAPAAEAK
jgi:ABC-type transporter MlaC component